MRAALISLATLLVAAGAVLAVALSGAVNVAASETDGRAMEWALSAIARRSVERHARTVAAMPPLDSADLVHGLDHFHAMCVDCHGAPGFERSEAGEGLNPPAPDLVEVIEEGEWSDAELFWIIKNGIRMTGMPAFGPTHGDRDLWAIVAVTSELPSLDEDAYRARIEALYASAGAAQGADSAGVPQGRTHVHSDGREHVH